MTGFPAHVREQIQRRANGLCAVQSVKSDVAEGATNTARPLTTPPWYQQEGGLAVDATQTCSVDGCDRPKIARGWCGTHWARWRKHGTVELPERITYTVCVIDGCDNPSRSSRCPHCEMHYYRIRRRGTIELVKPNRKRRGICTIDGCGKRDKGPHGLCDKHYTRKVRHGDPLAFRPNPMPSGPDNPKWTGDLATYGAVHQRVKKARGVPSLHTCVDCGGQAQHWSYDHGDPNELFEEGYGAYSLEISHYAPRCVKCHKNFDMKFVMANRRWHRHAF